jgi:peroxiredoxin
MKTLFFALFAFMFMTLSAQNGYKVGDKATDFNLKNVDGKMVSLNKMGDAKGFIVIFTCNHCPYSIAYEDRIIELDKKYKALGYPVVAINPNDESVVAGETYEEMIERAKTKNFSFPYLKDYTQEVSNAYGAERTPHVFVLTKEGKDFVVSYIGAIDDNYKDAGAVTKHYVSDALDSLLNGKSPNPNFTKAIGCSVKRKS